MSTDQSRSPCHGSPVTVAASEGVAIPGQTGQQMTIKISGAASSGAYSLIEYSHAPGAPGLPAHLHRDHEEAFYGIEGQLTLVIGEFGESSVIVGAGQATVVPRGVIHRPANLSDHLVRFASISSPALDDFFTELGELIERGGGRLDTGDLQRLGYRHDTIFTTLPASAACVSNSPDRAGRGASGLHDAKNRRGDAGEPICAVAWLLVLRLTSGRLAAIRAMYVRNIPGHGMSVLATTGTVRWLGTAGKDLRSRASRAAWRFRLR